MAHVQAGANVAAIQEAAEAQGWFYPPDPSSKKYCTIGGNVACNAGGMHGGKYGVTRDFVIALSGFLPTGEAVTWGTATKKFAAGFNLRDLWIGSEGMLGVVTGAVLKLIPQPAARWTLLVIGLIAVIAIVRPEQDGLPLGWMAALAPVGVLLCGTTYQLLGSHLARLDPPTTTQLYTTWLPVLATAPLIPWLWEPVPHWQVWAAVGLMGVCSGVGHLLLLQAYIHATPSVVSPFLYSQIGFARALELSITIFDPCACRHTRPLGNAAHRAQ
jgi:hypothetical protein